MIGDLFDSPWKLLIIAAVLIILFGGKKMPDAARSLGKSMRILKTEVHDLHNDHEPEEKADAAQPSQAITPPPQQQQIDQLQQQIRDLQQQQSAAGRPVTVNGAAATETPTTQQPG